MVDKSRVASMSPDSFVQGGLMDDVDGTIIKARFVPWDYNGHLDHHVLGVAVTIQVEGEAEPYVQHYSAGDLEHFMPSKDGETPVNLENFGGEGYDPEDAEGIYALKVGKKEGLANSSNWAQFIVAALDAKFPPDRLTAGTDCFEGVMGHFNRVPQKKRSGLVKPTAAPGAKGKSDDILVITEFKGWATGGASKKPATASTSPAAAKSASSKPSVAAKPGTTPTSTATAASGNGASPLDDKLVEIVTGAVGTAGEEGLSKSKLPSFALKGLPGADKGKGVKRIVEAEFLSGHEEAWIYDADSGTLYAIPAE